MAVVPFDGTGTASVEPMMALPVPGVQKPHRRVGQRFQDRLEAAPKRPAGLKSRPVWLWQDRLGANPVVCCGEAGCQAQCPQPCRP